VNSADYSSWAKLYSESRPHYPAELFEHLATLCSRRERAWDCATGNGQAALALADHFPQVVASDPSPEQLAQAPRHPRIHYLVAAAEKPGLAPSALDLITVAAAVHWFNIEQFYLEAERVLRPGGVLAVWTYHIAHVEGICSDLLWEFYEKVVSPYFSAGARLVDDRYAGIHLPGTSLRTPQFWMEADWSGPEVLAFVRSWSGTQKYLKQQGDDPTETLQGELARLFAGRSTKCHLRWPVYLKVSRL
jgi:SAM-dependent methyltransferase